MSTFSLERLKSLSLHSYTAPSTPAETSLVSSGSHAKLLTFPLWPLCSRYTCMCIFQRHMSDACHVHDSRHKLGVIGQPRQASHLFIMPPVLKTHSHEYNPALYDLCMSFLWQPYQASHLSIMPLVLKTLLLQCKPAGHE